MNKLTHFTILLALVTLLFTSAFSGMPSKRYETNCGFFRIIETIFTNNTPCGFGRGEMLKIMQTYVTDIMKDLSDPQEMIVVLPNTPINTVMPTPSLFPTKMPTNVTLQPTAKPVRTRTIITHASIVTVTPIRTSLGSTSTLEPTATFIPTEIEVIPTSTEIPSTSTVEPTQEEPTQEEPTATPVPATEEPSVDTTTPEG